MNPLKNAIFGDWINGGLTGHETQADVETALQPYAVHGPEEKTRMSQRFTVLTYTRPTAPAQVEVWFRVGSPYVALIEYDNPAVQNLARTLETLDPPELALKNKRFRAGYMVRELVYARHGITLSLAEPFDLTDEPHPKVIHVQLYPATTLQFYVTEIGAGQEIRPYPRSETVESP